MLPESYITSVTAAAITDTNAHTLLSATENTRFLIKDIDVTNTSSTVDTALDIVVDSQVKWSIPAGRSNGAPKSFEPELDCGLGESVSIKSRDAAELIASVRYRIGGR